MFSSDLIKIWMMLQIQTACLLFLFGKVGNAGGWLLGSLVALPLLLYFQE